MDKYSVDISGLKNQDHTFDFEIDKDFFEFFSNDALQDGQLVVHIKLNKSETMIVAEVKTSGSIVLVCDRSLREFEKVLALDERVFYKFGENYEELADEVIMIPYNYAKIDFSQLIYDMLVLSIPQKIIHPDLEEVSTDGEEDSFVFSTDDESEIKEVNTEKTDPRWDKLKGLNFK